MMSAVLSDVVSGLLTPQVVNAACNAGGKLLKVHEMEYKYGSAPGAPVKDKRVLQLSSGGSQAAAIELAE